MIHTCEVCNRYIPQGRVEAGYTKRCVKHSNTHRHGVFMVYPHKTGGDVQVVRSSPGEDHDEKLRIARRAHQRKR